MKHQTLEQLKVVAEVLPDGARPVMNRADKLMRWAELLDAQSGKRLTTLRETEYQTPGRREAMRADDSPISVAFSDEILREEGMKDDTYGEARRFFELTDWQLHEIICYCHYGDSVAATSAAHHVRVAAGSEQAGVFSRLREAFIG